MTWSPSSTRFTTCPTRWQLPSTFAPRSPTTSRSLADDDTLLLVEPNAADDVDGNLNPVGRVFYCASTVICVAHSKTESPKAALGAQAGEARLTALLNEAGFTRVRVATRTPFNMVIEARP